MNRLQPVLPAFPLLLALALPAQAASPALPDHCPPLPAGSGLQWQQQQRDSYLLCRATDADGEAVLNIMYTEREPDIPTPRSLREEKGTFAGSELYWYRQQIAGSDPASEALRRITVTELGKRQHAQLWINARDPAQLQQLIQLTGQLPASTGLAGR